MAASAGRGTGWRRETANERRQEGLTRHASKAVSPATFARQYLHEPVPETWRLSGRGEGFRAHVVSYADDFVILSRGSAEEALAWTRAVMTKLGLPLNEGKTSVKDARRTFRLPWLHVEVHDIFLMEAGGTWARAH